MADKSAVAVRYTAIKPADIVVSQLLGLKIYNNQNESVGEIEDLVIDNGRTLSGIVVGIGGLLGMGKNYVLIDPASIVISMRDNEMRANVDTSKDNLKEAPKFSYEKTSRP
jgi:sporulation protein YlmC with PRC-barrel domain